MFILNSPIKTAEINRNIAISERFFINVVAAIPNIVENAKMPMKNTIIK